MSKKKRPGSRSLPGASRQGRKRQAKSPARIASTSDRFKGKTFHVPAENSLIGSHGATVEELGSGEDAQRARLVARKSRAAIQGRAWKPDKDKPGGASAWEASVGKRLMHRDTFVGELEALCALRGRVHIVDSDGAPLVEVESGVRVRAVLREVVAYALEYGARPADLFAAMRKVTYGSYDGAPSVNFVEGGT